MTERTSTKSCVQVFCVARPGSQLARISTCVCLVVVAPACLAPYLECEAVEPVGVEQLRVLLHIEVHHLQPRTARQSALSTSIPV